MNEPMGPNSKWAQDDQFKPDMTHPDEEIECWHCGGKFQMREMVFEMRWFDENGNRVFNADGPLVLEGCEGFAGADAFGRFVCHGMWWCPNPECNGRGFGVDLHTVRDYLGEFLDRADAQD